MNNIKTALTIFYTFLASIAAWILSLIFYKGNPVWFFAITTIIIFCIMIWFFLTHDPYKEKGGYDKK